jgi:phage I-like protein
METAQRLAFLYDAPTLEGFAFPDGAPEDIPDETAKPTSRIQVAKLGTFKHPRYGRFKVTRETFDSFIRNLPVVLAGGEAPIDFDHTPDYGGPSRACGWIKKLTVEGDALLADVEWTWNGAFSIREGEYRYFSPTWVMNFVDDEGVAHGPTLIGGGLTNRPFFNRMAVVNCSRSFAREDFEPAVEDDPDPSDSRGAMSTFATIAKQLGLGDDATEDQVLTAARELQARAETSLEDAATAQGMVVMTAAKAAELQADAANASAAISRIEGLEKSAADTRFEQAFTAALTDPKGARVTPAEKDSLRKIFDVDEEAFTASLAARIPVIQTASTGDAGEREQDAPEGVDAERFALDRKVQAYMREHDGVDYETALTRVLEGATA